MDSWSTSKQLMSEGRFGDALKALDDSPIAHKERFASDVLRAELLEHVGRHGPSRALAESLLRSSH